MHYKYLLAMTFNEFQVLYTSSELRLFRNRLMQVPTNDSGEPTFTAKSGVEVLERAPQFDIEAEHSMLVAVLDQNPTIANPHLEQKSIQPISPDVFYLPINAIESFHALTVRGERILQGRLEGFEIVLTPPLFESDVLETLKIWNVRRSLLGASTLVEIVTGDSNYAVSSDFVKASLGALHFAQSGTSVPVPKGTFLDNLFCYERHNPDISREEIGFLADLGSILKASVSGKTADKNLDTLRKLLKALTVTPLAIHELLTLDDIIEAFDNFSSVQTDINMPLSSLFLKWKHTGLGSGKIDPTSIADDVNHANLKYSPSDLKQVIWLFGLYWGIDRLVPGYYYATAKDHKFLKPKKYRSSLPIALNEVLVDADPVVVAEDAEAESQYDQKDRPAKAEDGEINTDEKDEEQKETDEQAKDDKPPIKKAKSTGGKPKSKPVKKDETSQAKEENPPKKKAISKSVKPKSKAAVQPEGDTESTKQSNQTKSDQIDIPLETKDGEK